VLKVVHAVPTEVVSEQVSVQRVGEMAGAAKLRANVWTLNEGSQLKHAHREQEELYLVLDGVGQMLVDGATYRLGERDAIVVPAGVEHQLSNVGLGPLTYAVVAAPAVVDDLVCEPGGGASC
jgi:mannose-6-phosphate isomerase-like protein (cupin superfamily)